MSEPRTAVDRLREVTRLFADVQEVVDLVARVIAKYPYETLPPKLKQFHRAPTITLVRPSACTESELVLRASQGFLQDRTLRIPTQWLSLQQSQITAAVREIYWSEADYRLARQLERLRVAAEESEKQAAEFARKAIDAQKAHEVFALHLSKRPTKG